MTKVNPGQPVRSRTHGMKTIWPLVNKLCGIEMSVMLGTACGCVV